MIDAATAACRAMDVDGKSQMLARLAGELKYRAEHGYYELNTYAFGDAEKLALPEVMEELRRLGYVVRRPWFWRSFGEIKISWRL